MMEVDALLCVRKGDANMLCRICDDERSELEAILNIVSDYAGEHPGLCLAAQCFSNPSDMLDEMDRNGAPDVAPLDICMPGVLGTEVARESRRLYADGALQPAGRGVCQRQRERCVRRHHHRPARAESDGQRDKHTRYLQGI